MKKSIDKTGYYG